MAEILHEQGCDRERLFKILSAFDRATNTEMWLLHKTYAHQVY